MFLAACLLTAAGAPPDEPKTTTTTKSQSWGYSWNWKSGDPLPALPPLPGFEPFRTLPKFPADPRPPEAARRFNPGRMELFPDLPGFEPFPDLALPAGPGAKSGFTMRSAATDVTRDGDRFTAKRTDRAGTLEVTGRVAGGVPVPDEVTVRDAGKKATTYKLSEVPEGRREALRALLEQVR